MHGFEENQLRRRDVNVLAVRDQLPILGGMLCVLPEKQALLHGMQQGEEGVLHVQVERERLACRGPRLLLNHCKLSLFPIQPPPIHASDVLATVHPGEIPQVLGHPLALASTSWMYPSRRFGRRSSSAKCAGRASRSTNPNTFMSGWCASSCTRSRRDLLLTGTTHAQPKLFGCSVRPLIEPAARTRSDLLNKRCLALPRYRTRSLASID